MTKFKVGDRVSNVHRLRGTIVAIEKMHQFWPGPIGPMVDSYTIQWDTEPALQPHFQEHELTLLAETAKPKTDLQRVTDKEQELIKERKLLEQKLVDVKREIDRVRTAKTVLQSL